MPRLEELQSGEETSQVNHVSSLLGHYIRGEFTGDELFAINSHLSACSSCRYGLLSEVVSLQETSIGFFTLESRMSVGEEAAIRVLDPFDPKIWEAGILTLAPSSLTLRTAATLRRHGIIQIVLRKFLIIGKIDLCAQIHGQSYAEIRVLSMVLCSSDSQIPLTMSKVAELRAC